MNLKLEHFVNTFPPSSYHRGKRYARESRVKILTSTPLLIESEIQGSSSTPYQAKIWESQQNIFAECSCPIKYKCKHIIATIIESLKNEKQPLSFSKKSTAKTSSQMIELTNEEKQWLEKISACSDSSAPPALPTFGLFYMLDPHKHSADKLLIHLCIGRRKKGGDLSTANHKTYSEDQMFETIFPQAIKNACEPSDSKIIECLWKKRMHFTNQETEIIQQMVETGRAVFQSTKNPRLQWGPEKKGHLTWGVMPSCSHPTLLIQTDSPQIQCFLFANGGIYVDVHTHTCGYLSLPAQPSQLRQILSTPFINSQHVSLIQTELSKKIPDLAVREKPIVEIERTNPTPCITLNIKQTQWGENLLTGKLSFFYQDFEVPYDTNNRSAVSFIERKNVIYQIVRLADKEKNPVIHLRLDNWYGYGSNFEKHIPNQDLSYLMQYMHEFKNAGWIVKTSDSFPIKNILQAEDDWYIEVNETKNHWFELEIGQKIQGARVNLIPYLKQWLSTLPDGATSLDNLPDSEQKKEIAIPTDEGTIFMIPLGKIKTILDPFLGILNTTNQNSKIQLSHWQAPVLSHLTKNLQEGRLEWQAPDRCKTLIEQLKHIKKIERVESPSTLQAQLRPYQLEGVSWMQFLRKHSLAGVLADEMGLGKTIQTITNILIEKESGRLQHPALVIAPTTLMGNWLNETKKFAPSLKVLILQGHDRKKHFDSLNDFDLILTTYPLVVRDQEILLNKEYHLLILDEAQNIKNSKSQAYSIIQKIKASHKLCLTGTPMENHLGELWSLFSILLPGFLGNEKEFQKLFRKPIEKEGSLDRKKILQQRIAPFLLRRMKSEVTTELPAKNEFIQPIELSEKQQELYEAVRLTMMEKVMAEIQNKGLARSRIILLDALLKLRQICCDPRLLKVEKNSTEKDSAKLLYLEEMLPQMIENKQRILIFSQFTSMLDLIEVKLKDLSIPYVIITGQTKDRMTPVQQFQNNEAPVFLISLKAGGSGLNLTAADTVIHYDPWWNPAVENQATDRAHRIGQTKNVFVYKWIAKGTVEEKILQLQSKKKQLSDSLFSESNSSPLDLNLEDLQSLFAPIS